MVKKIGRDRRLCIGDRSLENWGSDVICVNAHEGEISLTNGSYGCEFGKLEKRNRITLPEDALVEAGILPGSRVSVRQIYPYYLTIVPFEDKAE